MIRADLQHFQEPEPMLQRLLPRRNSRFVCLGNLHARKNPKVPQKRSFVLQPVLGLFFTPFVFHALSTCHHRHEVMPLAPQALSLRSGASAKSFEQRQILQCCAQGELFQNRQTSQDPSQGHGYESLTTILDSRLAYKSISASFTFCKPTISKITCA